MRASLPATTHSKHPSVVHAQQPRRLRPCSCPRALPPSEDGSPWPSPSSRPGRTKIVREQITFVTAEGIVTIPGRELELPLPPKLIQPMPSVQEQGLCIGATFALAATNGVDVDRRVHFVGFCHSVDVLNEVLQEAVTTRGGQVLEQERKLKSGVHEQLKMTVCIPFLFGVPPEVEALSAAIASAGGIVDRVYKQWGIYRPTFTRDGSHSSHSYSGHSYGHAAAPRRARHHGQAGGDALC